ncbi:MAG TPA: alpha/beta fold hydrolase [Verrucomicrobiae bacterium]
MRLAFRQYGESGQPLVILHGLFGSRENWHSICLSLQAAYRVFALDQRNHGESPHAAEMDYGSMAEDVAEFLVQQELPRAHVLGHSMGAKTAMQLALLHPQQVQSLISVDMASTAYPPRHERILEGLLALDLDSSTNRQQLEQTLERWVPDLATRRFLLKNARRTDSGFRWRIGLKEIAQNSARLNEAVAGEPYAGPVLFIRGETSDYLGQQDLPGILKLFPRAQMRTIPRAGHLVHVDNPEVFANEIIRFLSRPD